MQFSQNFKRIFYIISFILFGSLYPVLSSVILTSSWPYKKKLTMRFKKPWFQMWLMNLAMCFFILPGLIHSILSKDKNNKYTFLHLLRVTGIPSICSIFSVVLQNYGLLSMPPTVWQVFFGFKILFACLFAMTIRKQQLFIVDWLGLFVSVAGMSFSGVAALLRGASPDTVNDVSETFFAFIIVIISHGVSAFQSILEEKILRTTNMGPSQLTGLEGLWGFFLGTFVALPFFNIVSVQNSLGLYENTIETFQLLGKSGLLIGLLIIYMVSISLYQYFGIGVTELSTALQRNIYEILRPFFVWILSLIAQRFTETVNEPLDKYTPLEIGGFFLSLIGLFIYNGIIRFSCFIYSDEPVSAEQLQLRTDEIGTSLFSEYPQNHSHD